MKRILAAYDGSEYANKAFAMALDLAVKYGAEMLVLAVARPPDIGNDIETEAVIANSKKHCHEMLKPLHPPAATSGVAVQFQVVVGHPAEQIVRHADEWGADLIVVGHRGRTFFEHWLIGSIARRVMAHASCAVLVAR